MRKPHRGACAVGLVLACVVIAGVINGCDAPARKPLQDPFFDDESTSMVSGDFDKDEAAWRKQLAREAHHPVAGDSLLKDDPPKSPEHYGKVAPSDESADPANGLSHDPYAVADEDIDTSVEPEQHGPTTFWQRMGRASFAVLTVLMTLGMMVAPYFLM